MAYYVYFIQSMIDGSFYIGYTADMERRIQKHNSGSSRYTSKKLPWRIVYTESFNNKTDAIRRERFLKKQKNRDFYEQLILSQSNHDASINKAGF